MFVFRIKMGYKLLNLTGRRDEKNAKICIGNLGLYGFV